MRAAIAASLVLAGTFAQTTKSSWSIGVLTGFKLTSASPGSVAARRTIDLRTKWDRTILLGPNRQEQKQPGEYPSVKLLSVSPDKARFVVNLWGLEDRDAGPLVVADAVTGDLISTVEISDENAAAAFVPAMPDRLIVHWTDSKSASGGKRTATFDVKTGKQVSDIPACEPAGNGFAFLGKGSELLCVKPGGQGYSVLDVASLKESRTLNIPGEGQAAVLDVQGAMILFERLDSERKIGAWRYTKPEAGPVSIDREPSAGQPASTYFLAGDGTRVVKWNRTRDSAVVIYRTDDGKPLSHLRIGATIQSYSVHPKGDPVGFAADSSIVLIDPNTGRMLSRIPQALPASTASESSIFWYLRP